MSIQYDKKLLGLSRELRKNMTPEEKHLWYDFLKKLPVSVHRQKKIENYIVDFFIASKHIAIEIDGAQHGTRKNQAYDQERSQALEKLGIKVIRYSNKDINERFIDVCNDILSQLGISVNEMKR